MKKCYLFNVIYSTVLHVKAWYSFTRYVTGTLDYESHRRKNHKTLFSRTENHHFVTFVIVSVSQMITPSHHFKHDNVELGYYDIINI